MKGDPQGPGRLASSELSLMGVKKVAALAIRVRSGKIDAFPEERSVGAVPKSFEALGRI